MGERLEEAVAREAKEETGLDIHDIKFINFQQFIYDPAFWKKRHFIFFDFACKPTARMCNSMTRPRAMSGWSRATR